jgi:hypothetical protein
MPCSLVLGRNQLPPSIGYYSAMNMEAVGSLELCFLSIELQNVRAQRNVVITTTLMMEAGISFENLVHIYETKTSYFIKP